MQPTMQKVAKTLQTTETDLTALITRAKLLATLNKVFQQQLELPLREHCYVANIENNRLTIFTDSAAWSTQLYYQQQRLLAVLQQQADFKQLKTLHIRVQPPQVTAKRSTSTRTLSSENADCLLAAADSITDSQLHASLKKLAQQVKSPTKVAYKK